MAISILINRASLCPTPIANRPSYTLCLTWILEFYRSDISAMSSNIIFLLLSCSDFDIEGL